MDSKALKVNTSDNAVIALIPVKKGDASIIEGEKLFVAVHDIVKINKSILVNYLKRGPAF